jgi:hypothetical protein
MNNTTTNQFNHLTNRQLIAALRAEFSKNAVNEMWVARAKFEMTRRPHTHKWIGTECAWCDLGTDRAFMGWGDIVAEVRESEQTSDAVLNGVLHISTGRGW